MMKVFFWTLTIIVMELSELMNSYYKNHDIIIITIFCVFSYAALAIN